LKNSNPLNGIILDEAHALTYQNGQCLRFPKACSPGFQKSIRTQVHEILGRDIKEFKMAYVSQTQFILI